MKILYIQVLYKYLMGTYFFSLSLSHAVVCIITSYNSKMYSRDFTVSEAMQQLSNDDTKISTAIKHTCVKIHAKLYTAQWIALNLSMMAPDMSDSSKPNSCTFVNIKKKKSSKVKCGVCHFRSKDDLIFRNGFYNLGNGK